MVVTALPGYLLLIVLHLTCYWQYVSSSQHGLNLSRATSGPLNRSDKFIYILNSEKLPAGEVQSFKVALDTVNADPCRFKLQIYRPTNVGLLNFTLVGQQNVSGLPKDIQRQDHPIGLSTTRIFTQQNDVLGILNEDDHTCVRYFLDATYIYDSKFHKYTGDPPLPGSNVVFQEIQQSEAFGIAVLIDTGSTNQNNNPNTTPPNTTPPKTTASPIQNTTPSATQSSNTNRGPTYRGADGMTGATGAKGDKGERGPTGSKGSTGDKGSPGEKGSQGPQGNPGSPGEKGDKGDRGQVGSRGEAGDPGSNGETGPRGEQGEQGQKGIQGPRGSTGSKGDIGPRGQDGIKGVKGEIGPRGDQGLRGVTGPYGATGVAGSKGETGQEGVVGPPGVTGPAGLTGPVGPVGPNFTDTDECKTAGCSHGCVNTLGSFYCTCNAGYVLRPTDNKTCIDANGCAKDNGHCHQECVDDIGLHTCRCRTGFTLGPDRQSCSDDDECKTNDGGCSSDEKCINTPGSRVCVPKVIETVGTGSSGSAAAQVNCEGGTGLLSKMTIIGFIVWLIILSIICLIILVCLFVRKGKRSDDYRYQHDEVSRRFSEAYDDQRSHKSVPFSSRLPEVNYY